MSRTFDFRRIPLWIPFLAMAAAVLVYLSRSYLWMWRFNPAALLIRIVVLIPVALLFAALATLIVWYLFRMVLPGLTRYRQLRMIRYQRSLRLPNHEQDSDSH